MSVWGVASLAGLEQGVWAHMSDLDSIRSKGLSQVFRRQEGSQQVIEVYQKWLEACRRFTNWNSSESD